MQLAASILLLCATTSAAVARPDPYATIEIAPDRSLLRATLVSVPDAMPADITLTADTGERVTATSVTPYARTTTPITIGLLYSGDEIFVGNEEHEPEGLTRYAGTLNALKAALDQPAFTTAFPAGSQLVAVAYDIDARVRYRRGALAQFHGSALGVQREYRGRLGRELVNGIEHTLNELELATTPRRALIVVSDGTDSNSETAKERLALLKKRAVSSGIELYGVIFKTPVSDDSSVVTSMIPRARTILSTRGMDVAIADIAADIGRRYEVTFPLAKLPNDGKAHALTVTIGHMELDSVSLVLPRAPGAWFSWWPQLGLGAAAALLLVLGAIVKSRLSR